MEGPAEGRLKLNAVRLPPAPSPSADCSRIVTLFFVLFFIVLRRWVSSSSSTLQASSANFFFLIRHFSPLKVESASSTCRPTEPRVGTWTGRGKFLHSGAIIPSAPNDANYCGKSREAYAIWGLCHASRD